MTDAAPDDGVTACQAGAGVGGSAAITPRAAIACTAAAATATDRMCSLLDFPPAIRPPLDLRERPPPAARYDTILNESGTIADGDARSTDSPRLPRARVP